jgi:hypothetical protein
MYVAQDENPQILKGENISKDDVEKLRNEQRVRICCEYYKILRQIYNTETMEELDKLLVKLEQMLRDNLETSPGELEFRVKQKLENLSKENREFVANLKKEIADELDKVPRLDLSREERDSTLDEMLKEGFGSYGAQKSPEKPAEIIPLRPKKL